jgi:hypothetical protein
VNDVPDDFPLSKDEMRELMAEAIRSASDESMSSAITAVAQVQVQWYRAWLAAGAPEPRAAEWAGILVASLFRPA